MENEKMKVVTIKKACDILGCSRGTFANKHQIKLTKYTDRNGYHVYYSFDQVTKLAEEEEAKKKNIITDFEVVK